LYILAAWRGRWTVIGAHASRASAATRRAVSSPTGGLPTGGKQGKSNGKAVICRSRIDARHHRTGLFGQAQAAPASKAAECNVAARAGDTTWQEHYHCWDAGNAAKTVPIAAKPAAHKAPECDIAARFNDAAWQEHYHCWQ